MPVCSIKGCNREAYDFGLKISLCPVCINDVWKYLAKIGKTPAPPVKKAKPKPAAKARAKPAPAKPKAPAKPVLKGDNEIEQVVMDYLGKRGQALVETILERYDIKKGEHPSRAARVVAVMKALAEKDPSLEIVGVGADSRLRRKAQETPAPQA